MIQKVVLAALLVLVLPIHGLAQPASPAGGNDKGKALYDEWCSQCHGKEGAGDGYAAERVNPKPRDFTFGVYKFRSTPSGSPPTDADLIRSIRQGMHGTSMPGWGRFSDAEVKAMAQYIQGFSPDVFEERDKPIKMGTPPKASKEVVEKGKEIYKDAKCWECHGQVGRGDGDKAWEPDFMDDWEQRIVPRDLTQSWGYRNGAAVEDIFRSVTTGLDGTPMASYEDSYTEEERWALAQYVKSLQVERKLGIALTGKRVEKLPAGPDDAAWDEADHLDVPMVGQIIVEPRMFAARVDNVRVRAIYTDAEIAVLLEWDDRQPNGSVESAAEGEAEQKGAKEGTEEAEEAEARTPPDGVGIQFPVKLSGGVAKPYFGMGERKKPVYMWAWRANAEGAAEYNAKGPKKEAITLQPESSVSAKSVYKDGRYRVAFFRKLTNEEKDDLQFLAGEFIPFALMASDGDNGEEKAKKAISAWYYLLLEPPTPMSVYLMPPLVGVLVVFGEIWIARAVRRRRKGQ